ncbi:MAG: AMP-binding protein [Bacteroidia bacterium]|nr:AMP-binding protein [Bacteroidia bacterium]
MKTLPQFFEDHVAKYSNNILMWEKKADKYEGATYKEIQESVHQFAAGLMSMGINKGDRITLLSEGRNAWLICELGMLYAGAVNVPLSVKLMELPEIKFRIEHSISRIIIVSASQLQKIRNLKNEFTMVEKIIVLDDVGKLEEGEIYYKQALIRGQEFLKSKFAEFEYRWKSLHENDYANICYTSGTTADPKGIILSHLNYVTNVDQACGLMYIPPEFINLIILPWDHAFAHTAGLYCFIRMGAGIASVQTGKTAMETLKNIPVNIKEIKPGLMLSVPALAKNFKKNIEAGIAAKGPAIEKLFRKALKTAYEYNGNGWDKKRGFQFFNKLILKIYDKLIFRKIRENFGGRLEFFIGGGALLDLELQKFFYAIGIPMFQGYGLSEAAPIISSNAPQKHKLGTSGFPVKNMELKICDDKGNALPVGEKGEIVVKGDNVMVGYWRNDKATKETLRDGWLHTGDMGYLDTDGFLYVSGRFKSLLISSDGEKYSPEGIEETLVEHSPFIEQCMLYNNQNPFTVALIVPNKEALKRALKEKALSVDTPEGQSEALKIIQAEINQYKEGGKYAGIFPQRWLPSAISILEESFTEQNKLMNSTLKIVRGKITEHYKDRIEFLYTAGAKDVCNETNLTAIKNLLV